MGLFRRRSDDAGARPARAVIAAAMPLTGPAGKQAWNNSSADVQWQQQAWYYYDATGELRFSFNWLASALSRAVLFAAEMDPETGQITGPTDDPRAQAAARQVLGGPESMPVLLSLIALHWQVSGETYLLIVPQGRSQPDAWFAMTRNSLRERGGSWSFKHPHTGVWTKLRGETDRVIRLWQSHPDEQTHADCAMRAAIPICAEIEKASQNIAARLDSRLAGNGLYFLPQEMDFPDVDGEPGSVQTFMKMVLEASEISIANPGQAAAQVPIFAQVPGEFIAALADGHVDLSTNLDAAVPELREAAVTRLGRTLDLSKEIAVSQMAEANHWTAWQIEEGTYKIHLEPLLLKFGMALTTEYYRGVLAAMGVESPERFVLNWNVTEVVSKPDNTEDAKWLWDNLLVSDDYVRSEFGIPDDAIPVDEELFLRRLAEAVKVAPTLAADAEIAQKLFGLEIAPAAAGVSESAVSAPALEAGTEPPPADAVPVRATEPDAGLVAAAELVVFDALSRAGGRLLTPAYRGQFKSVPRHELHTVIPVGDGDHGRLTEGSFQFTGPVAEAFGIRPDALKRGVSQYVSHLLWSRRAHDRETLRVYLRDAL